MQNGALRGFHDRSDAGRRLAALLWKYVNDEDAMILALPRGGVPVAAEVSTTLSKPIDVLVVRKLGVPGDEETAMGAITCGGVRILDERTIERFGISGAQVDEVVKRECEELKRSLAAYREDRPEPDVRDKRVILVDDGIATGATVSAAISLLRRQGAGAVIVAVPVAPKDTVRELRGEADDVVVVAEPEEFGAVADWYAEYPETTDEEVRTILSGNTPELAVVADGGVQWIFNRSPIQMIRRLARPFVGEESDYDGLVEMAGDATVVVLGAASYGTGDFHQVRAGLTKRLIAEKGFNAVVTEADSVDAWRVNDFVRGRSGDPDVSAAMSDFSRFPAWVWCNEEFEDLVSWLRGHNRDVGDGRQVGFYGLDLFGLRRSIGTVVRELAREGPEALDKARSLFGCVDRFGRDPQNYGLVASPEVSDQLRADLVRCLVDERFATFGSLPEKGSGPVDDALLGFIKELPSEQIADYYRKLFRSYASSWNLRDELMMEMLSSLVAALRTHAGGAKVIVWAHNAHAGDARATEMSWRGEVSLGQLVREAFAGETRLIGTTTYAGTVTASPGWGLPPEEVVLPPAGEGSFEKLFHQVGLPEFWLDFTADHPAVAALKRPRVERAVGVVHPRSNGSDWHAFEACIAGQFDAVIHCDVTRATVVPALERESAPA
ncbi:MAG: erythromycin esterase family protein [Akkermansiaceae bacterium]|nr:erythromycin esterase family protein [Akkermansiaceae bacterium]MCP5542908.1 erythromycin esterase family protein [Akkermansiaceae bacterium]MCP5548847.1 erythromycin esterase family protein [Akkermansiaceae bacterium]